LIYIYAYGYKAVNLRTMCYYIFIVHQHTL